MKKIFPISVLFLGLFSITSNAQTTQPFVFGINPCLQSNAQIQPSITAMKHFDMKIARYWSTGLFTSPLPDSTWNQARQYHQAGIESLVVLNFQNSVPRSSDPTVTVWTKYVSSIPPPASSGVTYFEIGNEIDLPAEYTGNPQQYAATLHAAYQILHSKGYKVVCGNTVSSHFLYQLIAAGVCKDCDFIGWHAYQGSASEALAAYQTLASVAEGNDVKIFVTECGLHANSKDLSGWAAETQKLYQGVRQLGGTYLQFPLYPTGTTASPQSLLDKDGNPNQPFYSAAEAALLNPLPVVTPPSAIPVVTPSSSTGSIEGSIVVSGILVYNDANNNGKLDPGESTTNTDANGNYIFKNQPAGNYKIREVAPQGMSQLSPTNNYGWTLTLKAGGALTGNVFVQQPSSAQP